MKRKMGMVLAGLASVVLCVSVAYTATLRGVKDPPPKAEIQKVNTEEPGLDGTNIPDYRCKECDGHHGGCYYPYCPDCHSKLCPPEPLPKPIPPSK